MPIHFRPHASRRLADAAPSGWPTVLCIGLSRETFRRIKTRLGRFEIHVRGNFPGRQVIGPADGTRPDAIIAPFGVPETGRDLALRLRREAAGRQIPVLLVADPPIRDEFGPARHDDGLESFRKPIPLDDLPDELSHYVEIRERFNGAGLESLDSASLCEVYRVACQSDFCG